MSERGYVGAWVSRKQANRKPISATDGVIGIIIMLSYLAGNKNLFPKDIDYNVYIDGIEFVPGRGYAVCLNEDQLSGLCEAMSSSIERFIKTVSIGSLKVYLSHIRNGRYPNNGGLCPRVDISYDNEGELQIFPRNFEEDVKTGIWEDVPAWLGEMVAKNDNK